MALLGQWKVCVSSLGRIPNWIAARATSADSTAYHFCGDFGWRKGQQTAKVGEREEGKG